MSDGASTGGAPGAPYSGPHRAPLALTMGEPAGIGGEITLKAWAARHSHHLPVFFTIGDPSHLTALAKHLELPVPVQTIDDPAETAAIFPYALPVLAAPLTGNTGLAVRLGHPQAEFSKTVMDWVAKGVALTREGKAAAVVTNPVHKKTLLDGGFPHPGHTDYLAALAFPRDNAENDALPRAAMMLACPALTPSLRVVPVTIHIPLGEVAARLSREAIVATARLTAAGLRQDFSISAPRLAVAAFNPHGGEDGALGDEEQRLIAPAISSLKAEGIEASGPWPADTLFHAAARRRFDAIICMYHDQALIPLKTLDFDHGVNVTLGLPFIRTSPDHGVALDRAGLGIAHPHSLMAALDMAAAIATQRARPLAGGF